MRASLEVTPLRAALLAAALGCPACSSARDVPPATVAESPAPSPPGAGAPAPPRPPAPPEKTACTAPGAQLTGKHEPRPLEPQEEQRLAEAEAYLRDHPTADDPRSRADLAERKYARARVLFEARRWAESAEAFRELALGFPDLDLGIHASLLYLESIDVLGTYATPGRPSCYDDMARDVPPLVDLHCHGARGGQNAEQCSVLRRIHRDLDRHSVEKLLQRARNDEAGAEKLYEQAAVAYLSLARRCCDEVRKARGSPRGEQCDELAFNAGKTFLAAHQVERAREAYALLVAPQCSMAGSPLAAKLGADPRLRSP